MSLRRLSNGWAVPAEALLDKDSVLLYSAALRRRVGVCVAPPKAQTPINAQAQVLRISFEAVWRATANAVHRRSKQG